MVSRRLYLLAALLFLGLILWRLPASWLTRRLPAFVQCENPSGSIWVGRCSALQAAGLRLQALSWRLSPLAILRRTLQVQVVLADPNLSASATIALRSGGAWQVHDLHAALPMPSAFLPAWPASYGGQLQLKMPSADGQGLVPERAAGTLVVMGLRDLRQQLLLGDYEVAFNNATQAGAYRGSLRELRAPFQVTGELRFDLQRTYEINGSVAAAATATPEQSRLLEPLGAVDAEGRRSFSIAGTF